MVLAGTNEVARGVLTPVALDQLGVGALLAYAFQKEWPVRRWLKPGAAISVCLVLMVEWARHHSVAPSVAIPLDLAAYATLFGFVVAGVVCFRGSRALALLRLPPVLFVGRISY